MSTPSISRRRFTISSLLAVLAAPLLGRTSLEPRQRPVRLFSLDLPNRRKVDVDPFKCGLVVEVTLTPVSGNRLCRVMLAYESGVDVWSVYKTLTVPLTPVSGVGGRVVAPVPIEELKAAARMSRHAPGLKREMEDAERDGSQPLPEATVAAVFGPA